MDWQVGAVRAALVPIGFGDLPAYPVLCFTSSGWPMFAKPQRISTARVMWPSKLIELVRATGPLATDGIQLVAHQLSGALPAAGRDFDEVAYLRAMRPSLLLSRNSVDCPT